MIPAGAISADSHVVEPPNCYLDHIDPKYRADAPRVVTQPNGSDAFVIRDMKGPVAFGLMDGAGFSVGERRERLETLKVSDVRECGWSGKARATYMDTDGIAAEVIYASVGMALCLHEDPAYKNACMQAYNRWLQGFCAELPERLFGLAQTAVLSVDSAIEDFRRARDMGFVGMMMPGHPVYEDYDHADYDALWECAEDLGLPVSFHILTSREGSLFAPGRGHPLNNFLRIIRAVQDVVGLMVFGGVFERHPRLKMVCAEADAGWLPHYMYRMDHAALVSAPGGILPGLSRLPSEYLRSNVYVTFQDDWIAFKTAHLLDAGQLLWANDFPHTDSTWPRSQELIGKHAAELSEEQRQAILRDNVAKVFGLDAGQRSWRMSAR